MPKLPGIKLGKASLLHPPPVTVQQVVSPLLQSSQLGLCCCFTFLPWGSLLRRSRWVCGATPPGGFDMVGFGLGGNVCALCVPDHPLRSVFLGEADNLKF